MSSDPLGDGIDSATHVYNEALDLLGPPPGPTPDDEPACGVSYDHTLKLIDERDGSRTYECTECGAEIYDEDEEQR